MGDGVKGALMRCLGYIWTGKEREEEGGDQGVIVVGDKARK
jgi:hypothetical protein